MAESSRGRETSSQHTSVEVDPDEIALIRTDIPRWEDDLDRKIKLFTTIEAEATVEKKRGKHVVCEADSEAILLNIEVTRHEKGLDRGDEVTPFAISQTVNPTFQAISPKPLGLDKKDWVMSNSHPMFALRTLKRHP